MLILGIESSCDDTAAAILEIKNGQIKILAEKVASQLKMHEVYGGVVPEVAARAHAEMIIPVVRSVIDTVNQKPDLIAVTTGPGLITGLLVGLEAAKVLAFAWNKPLVPVNHIHGHLLSPLLPFENTPSDLTQLEYPLIALTVSGGHTELVLIEEGHHIKSLGRTLDDAAGECFDKVGKLLGLSYPGGPKISQLATKGNPRAIHFPRPLLKDNTLNFSFAGLKTAALYHIRDHGQPKSQTNLRFFWQKIIRRPKPSLEDFCASFQEAIIETLREKTRRALQKYPEAKSLLLSGGVSANPRLRDEIKKLATEHSLKFFLPAKKYCMDNAAMIALAGWFGYQKNQNQNWRNVIASPILKIEDNQTDS